MMTLRVCPMLAAVSLRLHDVWLKSEADLPIVFVPQKDLMV